MFKIVKRLLVLQMSSVLMASESDSGHENKNDVGLLNDFQVVKQTARNEAFYNRQNKTSSNNNNSKYLDQKRSSNRFKFDERKSQINAEVKPEKNNKRAGKKNLKPKKNLEERNMAQQIEVPSSKKNENFEIVETNKSELKPVNLHNSSKNVGSKISDSNPLQNGGILKLNPMNYGDRPINHGQSAKSAQGTIDFNIRGEIEDSMPSPTILNKQKSFLGNLVLPFFSFSKSTKSTSKISNASSVENTNSTTNVSNASSVENIISTTNVSNESSAGNSNPTTNVSNTSSVGNSQPPKQNPIIDASITSYYTDNSTMNHPLIKKLREDRSKRTNYASSWLSSYSTALSAPQAASSITSEFRSKYNKNEEDYKKYRRDEDLRIRDKYNPQVFAVDVTDEENKQLIEKMRDQCDAMANMLNQAILASTSN